MAGGCGGWVGGALFEGFEVVTDNIAESSGDALVGEVFVGAFGRGSEALGGGL